MYRLPVGFIACLLMFAVMGCGGGSSKTTGEVSGKVTYQGQPVTEGIVQFAPVGEGYFANANIDSDGSYTVSTPDGGLPVGDYRVTILPPTITTPDTADSPGGEAPKKVDNIPAKYRNPETSGLTISVAKGSQTFDIAMTE